MPQPGSRAQEDDETPQSGYEDALRRLTVERRTALARAERALREIAQLLPDAMAAGVSVLRASEFTGISRPTLYRMLADARRSEDLDGLAVRVGDALESLERDLGHAARPFDLAAYFQISTDEVFRLLMALYDMLAREVDSLGPVVLTTLIELLPELGPPEDPVLKMLLLHRLPTARVAWSTQLPEAEVLGWGTLGLLRLLPRMRASVTSMPPVPVEQVNASR
jgi:hypothetical protein